MEDIKILLIGCGHWGRNWYRTIIGSQYKLVGVVDPNPKIELAVPKFNNIEEVNVDYTHVIIATNAEFHSKIFELSNLPPERILIEKPCGVNIHDAHKLKDAFPGYIFLYSDEFQYIKNNLSRIGKPHYWKSIRASMGPRVRSDVSIIEDYMIHDLYMFLDLFGSSFIKQLNLTKEFDSPVLQSSCNLHLYTNKNIRGDFYSSWIYPDKERKIVISGTKGSFIWEGDNLYFDSTYWEGNQVVLGSRELIPSSSKSNLELELDFFILGNKPNINILKTWELLTQIKNKYESTFR
tara:strand:- start:1556 stop:2434 length:879 start_codon:yes stop_codon:yes gene_type:complete